VEPTSWALWETITECLAGKGPVLEIGAGNRPRVPISGSYFVDLSASAMRALRQRDGHCAAASGEALPFIDRCFDLVCAFEIVEHVADDRSLLREIQRVLRPGERFFFSVPLHMHFWTSHDVLAGHVRRYDPAELQSLLDGYGIPIERYSITMSPSSALYRNASARLARRFWRLGVALEGRMALPVYSWLDRRRGMNWQYSEFAGQARHANNAIIACRKS
jgi:SAM-dependent methyltransferase